MRELDFIPTEWVHDPRTGHECRVNSADVPEYQARGFIVGTIADERSRQNCAKMINDALADKSAAGESTDGDDTADGATKITRAQARAAAKAAKN